MLQPRTLNQTLRATRIASTALAERPGGGQDPSVLRFPDMSAVVTALWSQTRPDGTGYAPNTCANWHAVWFKLLDFGTRSDLLDDLAVSFLQDRRAHPRVRTATDPAPAGADTWTPTRRARRFPSR